MRNSVKKFRYLLVFCLALSIVPIVMAKTVTKDGITLPISDTPVTLKWMLGDHPDYAFDSSKMVWQEFAKRTNVKLEFVTVPDKNYDEKFSVVIASRNLPDLMRTNLDNAKRFGIEGAFLPLEDLIDKYTKSLKKLLTKDMRKDLRAGDGKIYCIPQLEADLISVGWVVRGDWLEKLGMKEPETLDDLYKVLVAFRDKDLDGNGVKDTIPLTSNNVGGTIGPVVQVTALCFGTRYEKRETPWNIERGKMVYTPTSPRFKEMLMWLNKLYKEDLLDKEFGTQPINPFHEKVTNGKAGAFTQWIAKADLLNTMNQGGKNPIPGFNLIVIVPPKGPHGDRAIETSTPARYGQSVALASSIKDPVLAIKYFDYRYSDEGTLLNQYGIEGVTFNYVNGKPRHIDSILNDKSGRIPKTVCAQDYGMSLPNNAMRAIIIPEFILPARREGYAKLAKVRGIYLPPLPILAYTPEEQKRVGTLMATIMTRQEEYMYKFITGQLDFATDWDGFVQTMSKLGVTEVMQIVNAAYKRGK